MVSYTEEVCGCVADDTEYHRGLRARLFDFGVRGIAGFEYNDEGEED